MLERLRCTLIELRQIIEDGFGTIQQTGAHVVLAQCGQRLNFLGVIQVSALRQPLVQTNGTIHLATPPE